MKKLLIFFVFSKIFAMDEWTEVNQDKKKIFKRIVKKVIDSNRFKLQKKLFDAIENSDLKVIQELTGKVDFTSRNGNGNTALAQAYKVGKWKIINELFENGARMYDFADKSIIIKINQEKPESLFKDVIIFTKKNNNSL